MHDAEDATQSLLLTRIEATALEQYMLARTVPIVSTQSVDGFPVLLGTSTLIDIAGVLYLVTADHLFEDGIDLKQLAIPTNPRSAELWTIGSFTRCAIHDRDLDIAAIQIESADTEHRLRAGWKVLPIDMIDSPSQSGRFALCGYPADLTRRTDDFLVGKLLTIYTDRLHQVPSDADRPVHPEVDLFFLCDDSAENLFGAKAELPRLQGTSGSSVWEIKEPAPGQPWLPESVLRVVGINSSYRKGRYFRSKNWWLSAEMLSKVDNIAVTEVASSLLARIAPRPIGSTERGAD